MRPFPVGVQYRSARSRRRCDIGRITPPLRKTTPLMELLSGDRGATALVRAAQEANEQMSAVEYGLTKR